MSTYKINRTKAIFDAQTAEGEVICKLDFVVADEMDISVYVDLPEGTDTITIQASPDLEGDFWVPVKTYEGATTETGDIVVGPHKRLKFNKVGATVVATVKAMGPLISKEVVV